MADVPRISNYLAGSNYPWGRKVVKPCGSVMQGGRHSKLWFGDYPDFPGKVLDSGEHLAETRQHKQKVLAIGDPALARRWSSAEPSGADSPTADDPEESDSDSAEIHSSGRWSPGCLRSTSCRNRGHQEWQRKTEVPFPSEKRGSCGFRWASTHLSRSVCTLCKPSEARVGLPCPKVGVAPTGLSVPDVRLMRPLQLFGCCCPCPGGFFTRPLFLVPACRWLQLHLEFVILP